MTSEPYVPPKIGFVRAEMHLGDGAWKKLTETEFDRFIAKITADALREAADDLAADIDKAPTKTQRRHMQYAISMLGGRATRMDYRARIEEEA